MNSQLPQVAQKKCMNACWCVLPLIMAVLLFFFFRTVITPWMVSVLAIVSYSVMIGTWASISKRIDFYVVFLLCTYLFYYGKYLLILIDRKGYYNDLTTYFGADFLNEVSLFILSCILVMHMSFLIFTIQLYGKRKIKGTLDKFYINKSGIEIVAWGMFIASFTFTIMILLTNIQNTQQYGYAYALEAYYSGHRVERFFSNFLPGAFILLILTYKNTSKIKYIVMLLGVYVVLYFASGSRLQAILLLVTIAIVYEWEFKHITKSGLAKMGMGALLLSFLLVTVSGIRNNIQNASSFLDIIKSIQANFVSDNFLIKLINECGFQINSIAIVIDKCPSAMSFNYGLTYLKGIGQLMPNLFWSQNPFMQESTDTLFAPYLNGGTFGIGSSYIAEAYYNFGGFSIIFMIVIGGAFALYQRNLNDTYRRKNNFLAKYLYLSIPTYALFYVRSDAVGFLRSFTYQSFIPCIAIIIMSTALRRKGMQSRDCKAGVIK